MQNIQITCAEFAIFWHNSATLIILSCSHCAMSRYITLHLELVKMMMIFVRINSIYWFVENLCDIVFWQLRSQVDEPDSINRMKGKFPAVDTECSACPGNPRFCFACFPKFHSTQWLMNWTVYHFLRYFDWPLNTDWLMTCTVYHIFTFVTVLTDGKCKIYFLCYMMQTEHDLFQQYYIQLF